MESDQLAEYLAQDLDAAFPDLVRRYQDALYRFSLGLSGRKEDAEEIAQDAFVRAYSALGRYDQVRVVGLALRPWLFAITLNVFRNRIRRRTFSVIALEGDFPQTDRQLDPERSSEDSERRRELAGVLQRLPESRRTAVVLRHVEGMTYPEIASVLGKPEGTVKADVHRGLQALKTIWLEHVSDVSA